MSALGQKRTSPVTKPMSALPPKADLRDLSRHVGFVPKADSCTAANARLFDYLVGKGDGGIVRAVFRLSTCSNLAARRSGGVAAEWGFGTEPANQVWRDLGNAAHTEQCHVAIHLILQQGKRALHARLASSHRREEERPADKHELRAKRERLEHVGAAPHGPVQ